MQEETELQQVFKRDINCLVDEDRNLRRKGLNNLLQELFKKENSSQAIHQLFQKTLLKNLLRVVSDKVEKNRELALNLIEKFFDNVNDIDPELVNSIIKEINLRLNVTPFPEQSEEIRLGLIRLLMKIFSKGYIQSFNWNLGDIAFMISKVLTDSYPDIKKECSKFIIDLSVGMKESIGSHSLVIIKSLAKNLAHQQSKVRKATVESLGAILLARNAGFHLKEVMPIVKQAVNDNVSEVRKASYQIIGRLLNEFSPSLLNDFETELVGMLLNGLSDTNEDIIKVCEELIDNVGKNIRELNVGEKMEREGEEGQH